MSDDIKQRLLDESFKGQEAMRREALARIEALEAQLAALRASAVAEPVYQTMTIEDPDSNPGLWMDTQKDVFEKLRLLPDIRFRVLYTRPAPAAPIPNLQGKLAGSPAAPVPASVREALTDIDSWRYDTLGQRPRDESANTEVNAAFDRGARMAFYRCSDRARAALASLPAPAAAPTREEIAAVLAQELWCGATFADAAPREREAFLRAADAILALKAASAKANHVALGTDLDDGQRGKERE